MSTVESTVVIDAQQAYDDAPQEAEGWSRATSLVVAGLAAVGAYKFGFMDKVVSPESPLAPLGEGPAPLIDLVPNLYGGMAFGAVVGSVLAVSANKVKKVARAGLELGALAVLGAGAAYANHRMGGDLLSAGMQQGISEPKALAFGVYAGTRAVAYNSPYESKVHPAVSTLPVTRMSWFLKEKALGRFRRSSRG